MVFLLSIRRCRFYLEEWTKGRKGPGRKIRGSSKPPTEVFGFHQTLKKKKKNKVIRKKNPQATHAIKGSTGFIWKVSKSHLEKKPCDALSTPNVGLNQVRLQALPHEHTCAKYSFHELPLGPKDLNQVEEKDKKIPLYGHRHIKRTFKGVFCKEPLCFNMKRTKLRIHVKYKVC